MPQADSPNARATTDQPPNIIVVIADDLAYGDLTCHGNPNAHTPRLDQLHGQAQRLTHYSSGFLCTPARAMLMTGRYAYRTRAIDTFCGRTTLDPDEVTLAQLLRNNGYATCLSGKWHLGDNHPSRPQDLGFDEVLMHLGGGLRQPANPGFYEDRDAYQDPDLLHNGTLTPHTGYCTDIFTDHAIDFARQHADQPFFIYLAYNAPHTPLEVDDQLVEPFRDRLSENHARVAAMVSNIDDNVGKLLDTLDQIGQADNTLVVFTSDHGPCGSSNHDGQARFNANLRGGKGSPYDGGVRVPSLWRFPARFGPPRDVDRIAAPIDILPTVADLAGIAPPQDRTIDGVSLTPLLNAPDEPAFTDANSRWPDRTLVLQWHRGDHPRPFVNTMTRSQQFKLVNGIELYDLDHDPSESTDIAAQHPDTVAALRADYLRWFDDVAHTRPDNFAPPPIHLGTPHENPTTLNENDRRIHVDDDWKNPRLTGHWEVLLVPDHAAYT
ncbi:MAG: arylsulfatase, partial [Planctomycetota bacterium]